MSAKSIILQLIKTMQLVATLRIHCHDEETRNGLTAIEHELIKTIHAMEKRSHE